MWQSWSVGAWVSWRVEILKKIIMSIVRFHTDLNVYRKAFDTAMKIYQVSLNFPKEERFSLTDQIRRSSRSVAVNISEAWGKRKYPKSLVAKLTDADGEARETQSWLEFALACEYINKPIFDELYADYHQILGMLVNMTNNPERWSNFNPKDSP